MEIKINILNQKLIRTVQVKKLWKNCGNNKTKKRHHLKLTHLRFHLRPEARQKSRQDH